MLLRSCRALLAPQALQGRLRTFASQSDEVSEQDKVGFVGLGNMGRRMAANLMRSGFNVVLYDQSPKAMHDLKETGAESASSPAELAAIEGLRVLITMLPSAQAVRDVYMGSDGILSAASDGGITGASAATLSFMVGGDPEAFKAAQPFLKATGKHALYCGRSGLGQTAKVCNNLALGIQMASVAEALALGSRLGLDPQTLSGVLNASSARCWSSEAYNPVPGVVEGTPASRDYKGGFATKLMVKDLGLAAAAAAHVGMALPMGEAASRLYSKVAEEDDRLDFGAVYKLAYADSTPPHRH